MSCISLCQLVLCIHSALDVMELYVWVLGMVIWYYMCTHNMVWLYFAIIWFYIVCYGMVGFNRAGYGVVMFVMVGRYVWYGVVW